MNNGENRQRSNQNKDLNFGIPIQVLANKGDLLIAHPYLPHTVAPNLSSGLFFFLFFVFVSLYVFSFFLKITLSFKKIFDIKFISVYHISTTMICKIFL